MAHPARLVGWPLWAQESAIYFVGPSNDHELAIVRIVDRIDMEGRLQLASIQEVVTVVDFLMTRSEGQFLMNYVQWRLENPIVK